MDGLTVVVPFWRGHEVLPDLLGDLPDGLPVVVVDDCSDRPLHLNRPNTRVVRLDERGYFAGAVNAGVAACDTDVLILNQDARLQDIAWLDLLAATRSDYATVGEGVMTHPAWPKGYVQGTFMFIRRDAWNAVGSLDGDEYPLWGGTCEWQLRACRRGYRVLPLDKVPGLIHRPRRKFKSPDGTVRRVMFGSAIQEALRQEQERWREFLATPPRISVIMPCYNYGHYLRDAVNSLVGGPTCLGDQPGQTFQSFEIVIVDDASTDDSWEVAQELADPWRSIRALRMEHNSGCPAALNYGIQHSYGEYIHILSADDMREPWALEQLLAGCRASDNHRVAYGDIRVIKDDKRDRLLRMYRYSVDRLLHKNMMPAGILYPRQAWKDAGGYRDEMREGREDWAFNVALARAGWYGVHVGESGNLIRREGHNRSLRTQDRFGEFKGRIMALFPDMYTGVGAVREPPVAGKLGGGRMNGMVLLRYVGGNVGMSNWYGPATGTRYEFGGKKVTGYVYAEDAPKMLSLRRRRKPLFRRAAAPVVTKFKPVPVVELGRLEAALPEPREVVLPEPTPPAFDPVEELMTVRGVGQATAVRLAEAGIETITALAEIDADALTDSLPGFAPWRAERIVQAARMM